MNEIARVRRTSASVFAADPSLGHVSFDISCEQVAKYAVAAPAWMTPTAAMLNTHPDRFLFGTDTVAPEDAAPYFAVFDMWAPIRRLLTPDASLKVRKANYQRIFEEGRRRVRAWESANAPGPRCAPMAAPRR